MTDSFPNEPAPFITFYSFKGGVGRSMALVNVAGIVAGRGFRVLAIDLDLEAPGISYLMGKERAEGEESPPGFVDLILQGVKQPKQSDLFRAEPAELVERYTQPYAIPEELRHSDEGFLRIMPAGRFDGGYGQRLNELALGKLYADGYGWRVIQAFKKKVQDSRAFDYVFVDSRTGFSEEAGICTRDLADYLVIVTGLNHQNTEGTARFLQALKASDPELKDFRVVLSPMPMGEDDLADRREAEIQRRLSDAWGEEVSVTLRIPYHPRLALTEEPYVFKRGRGDLYEAYIELEESVRAMLGADRDNEAIRDANYFGNLASQHFTRGLLDRGIEKLRDALEANPDEAALNCELCFYAYAHAWTEWPGALAKLKRLLKKGERTKGWKLKENVRVAREQGHPEPEFVEALAKVVSDEESIETLEQFPAWRDTEPQ